MSLLSRMPRDVWFLVFDWLTLGELWLAAGVCRLWRSVVYDHPTFWRDISIQSLSYSTIRASKARLKAGGTRICNLRIKLAEQNPTIVTLLYWLPTLLPRLRRLSLDLNPVYFDAVCDMLKHEAPRLEHFELSITPDGLQESYSIPANIFGGSAPSLSRVEFHFVEIPAFPVAAFAQVNMVVLSWWINGGLRFPHQVFSVFPHISRLVMTGGWAEFSQRISSDFRRRFAQLTYLDLAFEDGNNLPILQHLDTHSITALLIACPADAELLVLASQVQEPLHVTIEPIKLLGRCNMRSTICTSSGLVRAIEENSEIYDHAQGGLSVVRLLNLPLLETRMVELDIAVSLWDLVVPWLQSTTALEVLTVAIDADIPLAARSCSVVGCAPLRSLIIHGLHPYSRVRSGDLAQFCHAFSSRGVDVVLELVVVDGDLIDAGPGCAQALSL